MKDDLFAQLLESVRQGGAILRGDLKASRAFRFGEPDVRAVREAYGLSQRKFAALVGISSATTPAALMVIADRLAQPEGTWRPYTPPLMDRLLGVSWMRPPITTPETLES